VMPKYIYRRRNGFFAINVQAITDADLRIRNIVGIARWPGLVHDQTIFNTRTTKQDFENSRFGRYMLVGDSGYKLSTYSLV
jgi:hypothetical protein